MIGGLSSGNLLSNHGHCKHNDNKRKYYCICKSPDKWGQLGLCAWSTSHINALSEICFLRVNNAQDSTKPTPQGPQGGPSQTLTPPSEQGKLIIIVVMSVTQAITMSIIVTRPQCCNRCWYHPRLCEYIYIYIYWCSVTDTAYNIINWCGSIVQSCLKLGHGQQCLSKLPFA